MNEIKIQYAAGSKTIKDLSDESIVSIRKSWLNRDGDNITYLVQGKEVFIPKAPILQLEIPIIQEVPAKKNNTQAIPGRDCEKCICPKCENPKCGTGSECPDETKKICDKTVLYCQDQVLKGET
ncbi:MAG: hypothetical protein P4N41_18030 [Negativicutes bacterium]|nr:hypothetical protein [Negativicutes bacterium]